MIAAALQQLVESAPQPRRAGIVKGDWEITFEECGAPWALPLRTLVAELRRRSQRWTRYEATHAVTGTLVETVSSGDLAWQVDARTSLTETGAWDEGRQLVWLSGGRPVDLAGAVVEVPSFTRAALADERRHPRIAVSVPVALGVESTPAVTQDLSLGGAFVRTSRTVPLAHRLLLAFTAPSTGRAYFLAGQVVRTIAEEGFAVRFIQQDLQQRTEVRRAFTQLTRQA